MTSEHLALLTKDILVIQYEWWGGQKQDRWLWCAYLNGDVFDYDSKKSLIRLAEEKGLSWIVVRHHKKGTGQVSIIETSK
jgi:hypothetical protein